ncbi:group II intron reverse transcriptase/maturase [Aerococcus urinae]|nr:group II intron reverse transcriptase/maturase [Aerococcus urinae]
MGKAEKLRKQRSLQRNKVEPEKYAGVLSSRAIEYMKRHDGSLMSLVVREENLMRAAQSVRKNKGAAGIDGVSAKDAEAEVRKYLKPLQQKLMNATYKPQPVKRVEIPKANGGVRRLGIPVVRDRIVQQAIRQVIEPIIDPQLSPYSHGFRKGKSAHSALKQCVDYYETGYKVVVDCDLKNCFDNFNQDKMIHYLEQMVKDPAISRILRRFMSAGVIDLMGQLINSHTGTPQGGVISPLLCNVYLNELDRELERRGHRFVRYADDFAIFVKSKRAGERVIKSITTYIEKDLRLTVNHEKSQVGSPTRLKFLGCLIMPTRKGCRFRPTNEAKKKFKAKLKRLTSRKRPGPFKTIVKEINQVTQGWINYFGLGYIKTYIEDIEQWLNHRLRQLILKRWKNCRTKIIRLMRLGLDSDSAKRIAFSRKKYWRLSKTPEVHYALTTKRLRQWGLKSLTLLAKSAYLRY